MYIFAAILPALMVTGLYFFDHSVASKGEMAYVEVGKVVKEVMAFLLKVKRAKFVLDKARRWMWKGRSSAKYNYKHHLLVQRKLLHFVDAFHQYVMDRVYHSAWIELCSGIAFLLRILSFKLNVGHFPHLADLVTRINYNYFYMSDSGNLQTIPRFEANAARAGKATAARYNISGEIIAADPPSKTL